MYVAFNVWAHTFAVFTLTAPPPMLADAGSSALLAPTAHTPVMTFSSLRWWLLAAVHGASDFHAANAQMAGILQLEPTAQPADVRLEPNLGEVHTLLLPLTLMCPLKLLVSEQPRFGYEPLGLRASTFSHGLR